MHASNPIFQSGIRGTGFHMLNFDIHIFEKILKSNYFSWYMRCMDGSLNLNLILGLILEYIVDMLLYA